MNFRKSTFYCDKSKAKGKPGFSFSSSECNINVNIYVKEACDYEMMPYDSFWREQKIFICVIYGIYLVFLLISLFYEFMYQTEQIIGVEK